MKDNFRNIKRLLFMKLKSFFTVRTASLHFRSLSFNVYIPEV